MKALGMTSKSLAEKTGRNRGYISKLIHGLVTPSSVSRGVIRAALEDEGADRGYLDTILPQTLPEPVTGPGHALYIQKTPPATWQQVHDAALLSGMTIKDYIVALYAEADAQGSHPLALVRAASAPGTGAREGGTDG